MRKETVGASGCDKLVSGGHVEMWKFVARKKGKLKRNENRIGKQTSFSFPP